VIVGYALMIGLTVGAYFAIRAWGNGLAAPAPATGPHFGQGSGENRVNTLLHVLVALGVVVVAARTLGNLFRRLEQPPVVGEIVAGLMLGPSLLGRISPEAYEFLLPASVAPFLGIISQVGVVLYMFLVGLELDPALLRGRGHTTVAISHASIIAPFLLGALLALWLYPTLSTKDVPFTCFSLFLGVSMSVTAFPVLARILTDRRIHTTRMGVIALSCAAVDDVTAWCLLAIVVSVVKASASGALLTTLLALAFIAVMALLVRPGMVRLARVYGNRGRLTQGVMALVFVALLASSGATESIGIHAVFGAFALGAVIPHDSGFARELTDRLEDIVVVLLLPAFFAFTGMRTQIGLMSSAGDWLVCGVIVLVASAGKFGGSAIAARATGLGWRDASSLGVLMNTRGLMELIVLNIGRDLNVISPILFAMLVVMAIVTTLATTPVLRWIGRGSPPEGPAADTTSLADVSRQAGLLVPVSNPGGVRQLVTLAAAATRPSDPPPRVVALAPRPPGGVRSGLRELEHHVPPTSPALAAAIEHAQEQRLVIDPLLSWSDDPAADILRLAENARFGWVLLGHHRPVLGADPFGGVVKEVLQRAPELGVNVAVSLHGHETRLERIVVVAGEERDSTAALAFGARLAASALHVVLVPSRAGADPGPELIERVRTLGRNAKRWVYTDVLHQRTADELVVKARADLVLIGLTLAVELGSLEELVRSGQALVVVRSRRGGPDDVRADELAT
jgi:Kef-type K+ transport system membrane component KefB